VNYRRGLGLQVAARVLLLAFLAQILPATAFADLSVPIRIPIAEWRAAMRSEMAVEIRCVKAPAEGEAPPGRRGKGPSLAPKQLLVSFAPPRTVEEAIAQGYTCVEVPRGRRFLAAWKAGAMVRRGPEATTPAPSWTGKARIPFEEWRDSPEESPFEGLPNEVGRRVPQGISDCDLAIGLQAAIRGQEEIRLGDLSACKVDGVRRSIRRVPRANTCGEVEHLVLDGDGDKTVKEGLIEGRFRGLRKSKGSNEALQARKRGRDQKRTAGLDHIEPVSCDLSEEGFAGQRVDDDVCVDRDEHQRAMPRRSSNSRSMSSFVRVPGGSESIRVTRLGRGLFASLFNRACRDSALRGVSFGDGRVFVRVDMGSSALRIADLVRSVPTPDPSHDASGQRGRGSCHVAGAPRAKGFGRDFRLTAEVEGSPSSPSAPSGDPSLGDDIKPVYNLKALTFSFPDADGLVTVSAPNGTFPPGTEILIINGGNGVVLGLTAGNDGQVEGTLPASTLDTLLVSVTDPFGNTVIYRQSQFTNPATGETAIGPGGGSINGPGGTGLDIPEGALNDGGGEWKVKLSLVPESEYATIYPRDVLGKLLGDDLHIGSTLKMEANRPATFSREVDVRFPLPDFTKAPVDQRPADPKDAFYTIHRRILACPDGALDCAEADKIVTFEVIDEAKVQCKAVPSSTGPSEIPATCAPEDLEIVTASPPFAGLVGTAITTLLFLSWALPEPADFGRPTRGLIRGKVTRQAYVNGKLVTLAVEGATVSGVSPDEVDPLTGQPKPLAYIEGGTSATTTSTGTYALWDARYAGGPIEVVAISNNTTARGQGFEVLPGDPSYPRYKQEAVVNITFPTAAEPPPTPVIAVTLVRADNNAINLQGIAPLGVPLQVGIKGSLAGQAVTINGVEINGVNYGTRSDLTGRFDYILDPEFLPGAPGTYRLTGTALRAIGDPVSFGNTFRIVAAGGGVDTDNNAAPRVIEARTAPKSNARGVSVSSFVSLSFSEPVKNVLSNLTFTSTEGDVQFRVSGVKPDGTVVSDLSPAPTVAVTSVTLEPLFGLKFGTTYTVRALSGIEDLDTDASGPAPKFLDPYETTFVTFGPEGINPDSEDTYSTGGFVILKTDQSITGWTLKHLFSPSSWNGALVGYDASDPANLTELSSTLLQNRVIDIAGADTTIVVATGSNHRSHPGNLQVYDVTDPQAPQWVGAATVSSGAQDGTPSRIRLKGDKVYAATWRKGIQVASVAELKSGFAACCSAAHFTMRQDLNLDGGSFNTGAVLSTINVIDPVSPSVKPWMRDISVIDVVGETIIAVASSTGLVLANEAQQSVFYNAPPSYDGRTVKYAYAVETALIDGRSVVLVAGIDEAGQNVLIVMDISIPTNPTPIGSMLLATQGKAIADIEISDGKAYIGFDSPTSPQIEIVQIGDPAHPTSAGVVPGVGGRLQVIDGILYGASYGYATDGVIGGIRTAALGKILLVKTTGGPFQTRLGLSKEPATVELVVVPKATEVTTAEIVLTKGTGTPQVLPVNDMRATFPVGSLFDPNSIYKVRGRVNAGTPDELTSIERNMRPVELEFVATVEGQDADQTDGIPVFDARPWVEIDPIGPVNSEKFPLVSVSGSVVDPLAPIQKVLVGGEETAVEEVSAGAGGLGPFVGRFAREIRLLAQDQLVSVTATNSLGNMGSDSFWIRVNTAPNGTIAARVVLPLSSVPRQAAPAATSYFRVQAKDFGAGTLPPAAVELSTDRETKDIVLTRATNSLQSEQLFLVPARFAVPKGLPKAVADKLEATRIRASLGSKPRITYARPEIKDDAVASGIALLDAAGNTLNLVPGNIAAPQVWINYLAPEEVSPGIFEATITGTITDPVSAANAQAPAPVVTINGQTASVTGTGGNLAFSAAGITLPYPLTQVTVRVENSIGAVGAATKSVLTRDGDTVLSPPEVIDDGEVQVIPPLGTKVFKVRVVSPLGVTPPRATLKGVMSTTPTGPDSTPEVTFGAPRVNGTAYEYTSTKSFLASRFPGHALADPANPVAAQSSGVVPVEVGGLVSVSVSEGAFGGLEGTTEVSGFEIMAPREGGIQNITQTILPAEPPDFFGSPRPVTAKLGATVRWHGIKQLPRLLLLQPEILDEPDGTLNLSDELANSRRDSLTISGNLSVGFGEQLYRGEGVDSDGNIFSPEAHVYTFLPFQVENEAVIDGRLADPGAFQIDRGRYFVPQMTNGMELVYPNQTDREISDHLRKNNLRAISFKRNGGAVVTVIRSDGRDAFEPMVEEIANAPAIFPGANLPFEEQELDSDGTTYQDVIDAGYQNAWINTYGAAGGREWVEVRQRSNLVQLTRRKRKLPPSTSGVSIEYKEFHDRVTRDFNIFVATTVIGEATAPLLAFFGLIRTAQAAEGLFLLRGVDDGLRAAQTLRVTGASTTADGVELVLSPLSSTGQAIPIAAPLTSTADNIVVHFAPPPGSVPLPTQTFRPIIELRIAHDATPISGELTQLAQRYTDAARRVARARTPASKEAGRKAMREVSEEFGNRVADDFVDRVVKADGETFQRICCDKGHGKFDGVYKLTGPQGSRIVTVEAKGGQRAVNPFAAKFQNGRDMILNNQQVRAYQSSPEHWDDTLIAMRDGSPAERAAANELAAVGKTGTSHFWINARWKGVGPGGRSGTEPSIEVVVDKLALIR